MRLILLLLLLFASPAIAGTDAAKTYDLTWTIHATVPDGAKSSILWIAVPQELPEQRVGQIDVAGASEWSFVEDPDFKNRVVQVDLGSANGPVAVTLSTTVTRYPVSAPQPAVLSDTDRALFLRDEALVSLSPRVRELAAGIDDTDRARYDYVLAAMDYDKTAPGWGLGDTERACEVGKGNCTDFHSLFMSLSRARGVPAVFEMGYSTHPEGETDREGGYHCWAWFHNGTAWVPVDISEADKHPEKAEYFFGHLDADRITFSRGRDVALPGMKGEPLNYLPSGGYLEADGTPAGGVTRTISYEVSVVAGAEAGAGH